jgi:hypothetical protein
MVVRTIGPGVLRCACAFLVVLGFVPVANAAFIVTINGNTISDNAAGDTDPATGFITWNTTIDGYQIQLRSSTDNTRPTADLTTSQLRIVNTAAAGTVTGPLFVSISESFNAPPGYIGTQDMLNTLTRNLVAGLATSGTVSSTTTGESEAGGGAGSTSATTLTSSVDSGMSSGSFDRTSDFYLLTQAIDISGLLGGHGVTITASSFSSSQGGIPPVNPVPAPASLALMGSGIGFLGLAGLRSYRSRGKK